MFDRDFAAATSPPNPLSLKGEGGPDGVSAVTNRQVVSGTKVALAKSFRRLATDAEAQAWGILRNRGVLGLKFRRQQVICGFVVDFYCAALRLALEIDGEVHDSAEAMCFDHARSDVLRAHGIRVVRVPNHNVTEAGLSAVLSLSLQGEGRSVPEGTERGEVGAGAHQRELGFTLIEIMVAVALLAMLGIILATSTSALMGSIRDTKTTQELYHSARVALSRMERELSMAYLSKHQSEKRTTKTVFLGKSNALTFVYMGHRRMVRGATESDEGVVEYKVERDSKTGDNVLVRREKTVIDDQPYKGGRKQVIAGGVKKLTFAYWDMDKESWQSDWKVEIDNVREEEERKAAAATGVAAATGNLALGKALAGMKKEETHGPTDMWLPARVRITLILQTEEGKELTFETQTRIRIMQPLDLGGIQVPAAFANTLNPYAAMPAQTPANFAVPGAQNNPMAPTGMGGPPPPGGGR